MIARAIAALILLFAQTSTPTASISGRVLQIGTNTPIRDARVEVMISPANRLGPVTATTDSEGRFVVSGVNPGTHWIEVSAPGFARQQYGQKVPTGLEGTSGRNLGMAITLTAGQRMANVEFRLTPTGSVTGKLHDRNGRPVTGVWVCLLRLSYSSRGQKSLITIARAQTDDRGDYRLYWITPGKYYVAANVSGVDDEDFRVPLGRESMVPMSFFPGVSEIGRADLIEVAAGAELTGMNMVVETQKFFSIRGRVVDPTTGRPPAEATFQLMTLTLSGGFPTGSRYPYDRSDGSFEISQVSPGSYLASVFTSSTGPSSRMPVTVVDSDIVGLVLTLQPSIVLPLKVSADHGTIASIQALARWYLSLTEVMGERTLGDVGRSSPWSAEGLAEFTNLQPGTYRFPSYAPSSEVFIKEVRYGNHDGLREAFSISEGSTESLSIVLGVNPGQIEASVIDAAGQPVGGISVVLIPDDRKRADLYKSGNTDSAGRFVFAGLAPGGYRVFAWESIEPLSWLDPQVIERYESLGGIVQVTESSKSAVTVRTIP